jgi:predicted FMN-binding regulatory protein PaiB
MTEEIKQIQKAAEELTATLHATAATEEETKTLDAISKAAAHIRQQLRERMPSAGTRIKVSDLRGARKLMQRYVQKNHSRHKHPQRIHRRGVLCYSPARD